VQEGEQEGGEMRKGVDLHEGPNLHVCNADESLVSQMLILVHGHK